ncbi:MAG: hypothetical protein KKA07_18105 [Bacteroidetes bacterium]|nr:hypothetical protein [Bacteroidota bacterium]MBU1720985.1 hypothetical protein [Bacteroidota bacterium]
MTDANQNDKYHNFREKYPFLEYEKFEIRVKGKDVHLVFNYNISELYSFEHTIELPGIATLAVMPPDDPKLHNIVFNIGMIETMNYWKLTCPQVIIVNPGFLSEDQVIWWKDLYFHGLGEFFYRNGIQPEFTDFLEILPETIDRFPSSTFETFNAILVPIGGGKDSSVTIETLMSKGYPVSCLAVNPTPAIKKTISLSGIPPEKVITVKRTLDPAIVRMNEEGYLNGHIPITAILSFISIYAGLVTGHGYVSFSNESSASEPTVPGTHINHQYSKSWRFERDFRNYINNHITKDIEYFSFLRPLSELQIGKIFSGLEKYHHDFRSCNSGSIKGGIWCCNCPKCLFTWVILSPFLEPAKLVSIFGENLFEKSSLAEILDELSGAKPVKPFECVGTNTEVNIALCMAAKQYEDNEPALIKHYKNTLQYDQYRTYDSNHFLEFVFDNAHFLPEGMEKTLKDAIKISRYP